MQNTPSAAKPRGFHKKGVKANVITGTKPSIHNNTLLVSTGVPSLDALIGESANVDVWLFTIQTHMQALKVTANT